MKKTEVDFTHHSNSGLQKALKNINRDKFPENYEACLAEISIRKKEGRWEELAESSEIEISPKESKIVAGLRIRFFSDFIDTIILWLLAFVLGLIFKNWLFVVGSSAIWIGLIISIAYFVPLQSGYGNGQSIGKSLLGIQVLDINGQKLSLQKSFIRYLTVSTVVYGEIYAGIVEKIVGYSLADKMSPIFLFFWLIAFAGCYLLIPFHPVKRGLHDLLANSIVVYRDKFNASEIEKMDSNKKIVRTAYVVGFVIISLLVFGFVSLTNTNLVRFTEEEQSIETILSSSGKFKNVNVVKNISYFNNRRSLQLIVTAVTGGPADQTAETMSPTYDLVFETIRNQIKDPAQYSAFRVNLQFGYNLGIGKHLITMTQEENPSNPAQRTKVFVKTQY